MSGQFVMLLIPCCILFGSIAVVVYALQFGRHARRTRLRLPFGILLHIRLAASGWSSIRIQDTYRGTLASLEESLRWLRAELRRMPALPSASGQPRIMSLAAGLASGECTARELKEALTAGETIREQKELRALPAAVGVALAEQLQVALPPLRSIFNQLIPRVSKHQDKYIYPEDAAYRDTDKPLKLDLRLLQQIDARFIGLRAMNWTETVEDLEPVYWLLLQDPSGLYPALTPSGRLLLRSSTARIAADFKTDPCTLLEQLLSISEAADERSNESHVAWWLMTRDGILRLHRELGMHSEWMSILVYSLRPYAYRLMLILLGVISGFGFLQARQPLLMLPAFLVVSGQIWRVLFRALQPEGVAQLALQTDVRSVDMRTLVVLPAVLAASSDAEAMFRRLKHACTTMKNVDADFLLLGDFPPSPTVCAGYDTPIICTAANMASELCNETSPARFMYIQRSRTRDDIHFTYAPRCGRHGAMETICQLVTQGECEDGIYFSTVSPAFLHRRYAFVLMLEVDESPAPDMLEKLLQTAACPLYTPVPTAAGHSGYAAFRPISAPGSGTASGRTMMIYPDAFLASTEGMIPDVLGNNALQLEMALCDCASVPDAYAGTDYRHDAAIQTADVLFRSYQAWLCILWQLPWVQTPAGFIRNPLDSSGRFSLREQLRQTMLPIAKLTLLLWSLLCGNWLLLSLTISASVYERFDSDSLLQRIGRLCLLPQDAAASLCGMYHALKSLSGRFVPVEAVQLPHNWENTVLWCQLAAAAASLAAGILSPVMLIPAGVLCACFAGYQAVAGWLDRAAE